jgi:glutaconate CoA-transferase subunit B
LVTGAALVTTQFELFSYYLQAGLIDVGFLGASQIDRYGNINTTVIGGYDAPKVRLPGSGGACEIAINAKKVFVIMPQSRRSFVERIDFKTSPGHLAGSRPAGWGVGPAVVVTQLGLYRFDETGEIVLASLHPGLTADEARDNTAWDLKIAPDVRETPSPTEEELRLIREELDPEGAYTR